MDVTKAFPAKSGTKAGSKELTNFVRCNLGVDVIKGKGEASLLPVVVQDLADRLLVERVHGDPREFKK